MAPERTGRYAADDVSERTVSFNECAEHAKQAAPVPRIGLAPRITGVLQRMSTTMQ